MQWKGASPFEFEGKSTEAETATRSKFPNWGKAIVEQMLVRRKKEIEESRTARLTVKDPSRKVNHLSNVI